MSARRPPPQYAPIIINIHNAPPPEPRRRDGFWKLVTAIVSLLAAGLGWFQR